MRVGTASESSYLSPVSAGLAGVAFATFRVPNGPDEAVSTLVRTNPRNLHADATGLRAPCARSTRQPGRYRVS